MSLKNPTIGRAWFENTMGNSFLTFLKYWTKRSKKNYNYNDIVLFKRSAFGNNLGLWEVHFQFKHFLKSKIISESRFLKKYYIITTRRYGPLRGHTSAFGQECFFALQTKETNYYDFWANFRQFWFPVVTLVTLKRIQKKSKKIQ